MQSKAMCSLMVYKKPLISTIVDLIILSILKHVYKKPLISTIVDV